MSGLVGFITGRVHPDKASTRNKASSCPTRLLLCAGGQIAELQLSHKQLTDAGLRKNETVRQLLPLYKTPDGAVTDVPLLLSLVLSGYAASVGGGAAGLPAALQAASGVGEIWLKVGGDAFPNLMMGGISSTTFTANVLPWQPELRRHAQSTGSIAVLGQYAGKDSHELIKANFGPTLETLQQLADGKLTVRVWVPEQERPYEIRVRLMLGGDMASHWAILATGGQQQVRRQWPAPAPAPCAGKPAAPRHHPHHPPPHRAPAFQADDGARLSHCFRCCAPPEERGKLFGVAKVQEGDTILAVSAVGVGGRAG